MSWQDIMKRMLPPIGGVSPNVTSPYGAKKDRPLGSTNPHRGVDFDYFGGQKAVLNKMNPSIRSPVDGIVRNAGQGNVGRIAIEDANGFMHEILHTHSREVSIGDPVAAGQLIGTMGNTGTKDQHVHYQLKNPAGEVVDPSAYWDQQGTAEFKPSPPAYLPEYEQYLHANDTGSLNGYDDFPATVKYPYLSRDLASQSQTPGKDGYRSGQNSFDERFGNWTSFSNGLSPRNPNLPVPPSEPGRPLGIVSGKPMPQWVVPPPIFGFPDDAGTPGKGPRSRSRPGASIFDTGTPPVPFVSPGEVPSLGGRAMLDNRPMDRSAVARDNLADTTSQASASPVLQYLQTLRQQAGNDAQQVPPSPGGLIAPLMPTDTSGAPIGGLLARLMAVAGINPDDDLGRDNAGRPWLR